MASKKELKKRIADLEEEVELLHRMMAAQQQAPTIIYLPHPQQQYPIHWWQTTTTNRPTVMITPETSHV